MLQWVAAMVAVEMRGLSEFDLRNIVLNLGYCRLFARFELEISSMCSEM